jgi:hypothetical protein
MNSPESVHHEDHPLKTAVKTGAVLAGPTLGTTAAAHELDAGGWVSLPAIQEIPGIEHVSSAAGGFGVGLVTAAAAERIAGHLDRRGHDTAAERVRRAGAVVAWLGSAACHLAIELGTKGVADKWDLAAGLAGTLPGIIAGRKMGEHRSQPDSQGHHPTYTT